MGETRSPPALLPPLSFHLQLGPLGLPSPLFIHDLQAGAEGEGHLLLPVCPHALSRSGPLSAEVCPEQSRSIVLPIVVGVVLCLLILIVLVAFGVGRWRAHTGYHSL